MPIPYKLRLIILCAIAFIATWVVFTPILKLAKSKNIVDNPDARKLQKEPVPVMGGIAVFFGSIVALSFYKTMISYTTLFPVLSGMTIMLYLGAIDDILTIKPTKRLVLEVMVALLIIYGTKDAFISDFQGLWGIGQLSTLVGTVLSVVTLVGIVNAINMIDGIDGLSSAFSILILGCFGVVCFLGHAFSLAVLSAVLIGALIPFFLHNVFGYTTKMFIGDSGTLMVGTAISSMVFVILSSRFEFPVKTPVLDFSKIAFCLAVLSIPIADTLRVMFFRMFHHKSPFSPDKNHLHHLFVACNFSYIWTTIIEITLNLIVIGVFFLSWGLGAGIAAQLYIVVFTALFLDLGAAKILSNLSRREDYASTKFGTLAVKTHVERVGLWRKIQRLIDGE